MKSRLALLAALLGAIPFVGAGPGAGAPPQTQCAPAAAMPAATTPVAYWSTEARCAIVPAGPAGAFGLENFGNKFPGEAAVYMGIVHVAIYDAAVAIEGGYRPYAIAVDRDPEGTSCARRRVGAHGPAWRLGRGDWKPYGKANRERTAARPASDSRTRGGRGSGKLPCSRVDEPAAAASDRDRRLRDARRPAADAAPGFERSGDPPRRLHGIYGRRSPTGRQRRAGRDRRAGRTGRARQARERRPGEEPDPRRPDPPPAGPGVWQPAPLRCPCSAFACPASGRSRSRAPPSSGPTAHALTSHEYADDFKQVKELGRLDSATGRRNRRPRPSSGPTTTSRSGTRHAPPRRARGLGPVQTARMLAMAHVAGCDAMIACFDAKYHYLSWRPLHAIQRADTDGNPQTEPDPTWQPLRPTPNSPRVPLRACLPHHGDHGGPGGFLRHRLRLLLARQPGDPDASLLAAQGRGQRGQPRTYPGRIPLHELGPGRKHPWPQGRALRGPPFLPAAGLTSTVPLRRRPDRPPPPCGLCRTPRGLPRTIGRRGESSATRCQRSLESPTRTSVSLRTTSLRVRAAVERHGDRQRLRRCHEEAGEPRPVHPERGVARAHLPAGCVRREPALAEDRVVAAAAPGTAAARSTGRARTSVTAPSVAVGRHPLATSPRQAIQAVSATIGLST